MRIIQDNKGNIIKEAETAEDYLLLEIERLKEKNKKLKEELEKTQENYMIKFNIYGFSSQEYKVKTEFGKINIEQIKKKKREAKKDE